MTCLQVQNMLAVRHFAYINHYARGAHILFSPNRVYFFCFFRAGDIITRISDSTDLFCIHTRNEFVLL
jgi:hypothetical protein